MQRLRGLNFGGWFSQIDAIKEKDPQTFPGIDKHMDTFLGEGDFAQVASWGFNHVRLPVDHYLFFTGDERPLGNRLEKMDRAINWAAANGLSLILDLHECPGHDFSETSNIPVQKLFSDPDYVKKTERIWAIIAERYGGHKHVLFEVLNEPVAPSAQIWNEIKDSLCKQIRRYAPESPIITGSNMWNWPSQFNSLTPVDIDNMIYTFHFYEPLLFTHQHAPWITEPEIRMTRDYPSDYGPGFVRKYDLVMSDGVWDKSRMERELEPVTSFGKKYGVDIICDEFGVYAPVPLNAQLKWLDDLLSTLKERNIGFSYWNYKNLDFGIISRGEKLHEGLSQYDNPRRINHDVLSVLRRN